MKRYGVTIFLFLQLSIINSIQFQLRIHSWHVEPYIYGDVQNLLGIVPGALGKHMVTTKLGQNQISLQYRIHETYQELLDVVSKVRKQGVVNMGNRVPLELYGPVYESELNKIPGDFKRLMLIKVDEQTFLIRSFYNGLLYRGLLYGVGFCVPFFLISVSLLFTFGVLVWLVERKHNGNFNRNFALGVWHGLYWATVTMTTVGYGDLTAITVKGKVLTVVWMLTSTILVSALTSMMTSGLTAHTSFERQQISYLKGVPLEDAIKSERAIPTAHWNYKDVFEAATNGMTFGAMADVNVVAHFQESLSRGGLETERHVQEQLQLTFLISASSAANFSDLLNCIEEEFHEAVEDKLQILKKNKKQGDVRSLLYFISKNQSLFAGFCAIWLILVILGLGFECRYRWKDRAMKQDQEAEITIGKENVLSKDDVQKHPEIKCESELDLKAMDKALNTLQNDISDLKDIFTNCINMAEDIKRKMKNKK